MPPVRRESPGRDPRPQLRARLNFPVKPLLWFHRPGGVRRAIGLARHKPTRVHDYKAHRSSGPPHRPAARRFWPDIERQIREAYFTLDGPSCGGNAYMVRQFRGVRFRPGGWAQMSSPLKDNCRKQDSAVQVSTCSTLSITVARRAARASVDARDD
jgi:hypothetical protein